MKSQEPSDLLDFERDIPTTPEDVRALEKHRPRAGEDWLRQLEELSQQFPVSPEDLARRPTFEGCEPFELYEPKATGLLRGLQIEIAEDFDTPLPDLWKAIED